MPRIFAYIVHKGGVADDTAAELLAAARRSMPRSRRTAIVTGWGADLDRVCEALACFVSRDLEDRPRSAGLSECRTGPQGAGQRAAARQHRAGAACALRRRPLARAFHQAERGVRLRTCWTSKAWKALAQTRPPGIRRTGEHSRPLRYFLRRGAEHPPGRVQAADRLRRQRAGGR